MKTIVHIELSDEERSHIAASTGGTHPVTRKDVTKLVNDFIQERINGREQEELQPVQRSDDQRSPVPRVGMPEQPDAPFTPSRQRGDGSDKKVHRDPLGVRRPDFIPSRGDEDYLAQPTDPGIAAACSRILDDTALINAFAWDTIERNRKK